MTFDTVFISRLENLARLKLNEAEREKFAHDLTKIIGMVDKLNELDTTGVEPLIWLSGEENIFREDEVKNQISREKALQNAPETDGKFFQVNKFLTMNDEL